MTASGRFILPITEPILDQDGTPISGATLTVYDAGTSNLSDLFAEAALSTPIANPQTSDSAGRFYDQTTVIWGASALAYDVVVDFGSSTETYEDIYVLGAATNTSGFAPLNSPNFTGVPTAPTPATNDNSQKIATTGYVQAQGYAPLASPGFTGVPTAPTAAVNTNTPQLATTAFVRTQIAAGVTAGTSISANLTLTTASNGTFAHGLGANPTNVEVFLICTSAIAPYAIGDLVKMDGNQGASAFYGVTAWIVNDSTNIRYQVGANGVVLPNASGVGMFVSSANFAIKIRAWL